MSAAGFAICSALEQKATPCISKKGGHSLKQKLSSISLAILSPERYQLPDVLSLITILYPLAQLINKLMGESYFVFVLFP